MKKYLLPFLFLCFWNCAPAPTFIPKYSKISAIDFSPFTEKGFLFTPNKYNGDYKSIGIINFTYFPEAKLTELKIKRNKRDDEGITKTFWDVESYDSNILLYEIYTSCVSLGADALTEFKIKNVQSKHGEDSTDPVTINGIEMYGFAIKRVTND
jgi:hypothetical protein